MTVQPTGPRTQWMQAQFERALRAFGLVVDGRLVPGVAGRTLSGRVADPVSGGARWLRVLAVPAERACGALWYGPITAPAIPGLSRPALLATETWADREQSVRAEVWELVDEPACAPHETLTPRRARQLRLSTAWWTSLETSLDRLARHRTDRVPRTQEQITAVMRRAYGPGVPTRVRRWAVQHGDLRWTNLTAHTPYLLDWEFWGLAPVGADAATLMCTSLLVPELAADIHRRFAHLLDTPDGRIAQLCVIVQLRRHPDIGDLDQPLAALAHRLSR
ncbi:aminoglycoside phosphotransferase [Actinomadura rugatobispora]|uniref:Aminoglycoside phosphotransferase n=1 Tax=Actinomadura rugatobispora TaxID=1994 RepID=A0ABW0ZVW0_9ACTN|nr:hypothetical protein GCM10010200_040930 [Actinomadura rugatobispora]